MEKRKSSPDAVKAKQVSDKTWLMAILWILAGMFITGTLINLYGLATGRMEMQPIALAFIVILSIVMLVLAILETRNLKRLKGDK